MQARGHSRAAIANLLRANQVAGWVLRKALRVFQVFVTGYAAVNRLAQKIGNGKLRVLAATLVLQVAGNELAELESFIQLPNQQRTGIGGDS